MELHCVYCDMPEMEAILKKSERGVDKEARKYEG